LCPDWPVEQRVTAVRVATAIGPRWLLVCRSCGRWVRRLYVPEEAGVAPWGCRHCWGLSYRRSRRSSARSQLAEVRARLAEFRQMAAELEGLEQALLRDLAEGG
jgi:hypothetical protein